MVLNNNFYIPWTPVWWYRPTPAVITFLTKNYLSSKKIYATNAGWLGKTFKGIKDLCKNSNVDDGMNIIFKSYSNKLVTKEKEIDSWINTL